MLLVERNTWCCALAGIRPVVQELCTTVHEMGGSASAIPGVITNAAAVTAPATTALIDFSIGSPVSCQAGRGGPAQTACGPAIVGELPLDCIGYKARASLDG